jgi:two-component system, chemotaxis family, CheB/CheR fusion protein
VLDSLPEHVAVLDNKGVVTMVNSAWREFARDHGDPELQETGVGGDYLAACESGRLAGASQAGEVLEGIKQVMTGERSFFCLEYPSEPGNETRHYLMYVAPIRHVRAGVVVSYIDITQWTDHGHG